MIICISGLSGSGKNSVGHLVAEKLHLRLIDPTFKTIAAKQKMSLLDFHKKAEHEHSIDKSFDARLMADAKKGNCVVCTWLGPWMIKNADIRVWLYAPSSARATRVAKRDGMSLEEAQRHIAERDESNRLRYLDIYTIDIYDHSGFDLVINSEKYLPADSAEIIAAAARSKSGAAKKSAAPKKTMKAKKKK
jgi:cytidylate kinase